MLKVILIIIRARKVKRLWVVADLHIWPHGCPPALRRIEVFVLRVPISNPVYKKPGPFVSPMVGLIRFKLADKHIVVAVVRSP